MASYNRLDNQKAKNDISLERKIGDFVFENFWSRLGAKERVNDKWLQIKGVDVKVGDWNVDEKVKYYDSKTKGFMTELLRYPSFEISFENQSGVLIQRTSPRTTLSSNLSQSSLTPRSSP